jgi:Diacylglycerol acyltransferase
MLQKVSRMIGFGLIIFYGRYYLPIPRRIPVLGVRGKAISTRHLQKNQNPSMEQIQDIQNKLIDSMQQLFDQTKHLYGWEGKQLIIK